MLYEGTSLEKGGETTEKVVLFFWSDVVRICKKRASPSQLAPNNHINSNQKRR